MTAPALPVLLDVDTGIDDALALLLAVRSPELELVAVGTVSGNVTAELAAANTLRALEAVGAGDVPVAVGAGAPLVERRADAAWVHGEDGLGNTGLPAPLGSPSGETAVAQLLRLSQVHAGVLTVIAVGPLTNIALALALDPGLASRLARLVIMGGSARAGGNLGPWAEANIGHDPEAAAMTFAAAVPRTMIGLDVTSQTTLGDTDVTAFAGSRDPAGEFAARILPHYLDVYAGFSGQRRCAVHDALAVAVAARPELVTTCALPVRVETAGHFTRGMTVVDLRHAPADAGEPVTDVALQVDGPAFRALLRDRLTGQRVT